MARRSKVDSIILELESYATEILPKLIKSNRPFLIEFAGTPKAGKTISTEALRLFLKRNGFKVYVVTEKAAISQISRKDHIFFNIANVCKTLAEILETLERKYHIIIIDRGLFDTLSWVEWFVTNGRLSQEEKGVIQQFLLMEKWLSLIDIVFLLKVNPKEAMKREFKDMLTRKSGSIMNDKALSQLNNSIDKAYNKFSRYFNKIITIDTTEKETIRGVEVISREAMKALNDISLTSNPFDS